MQRLEPKDLSSGALDDITRNRHGGNTFSELANIAITPFKKVRREQVMEFYMERGELGATTDEVAMHFNVPPNAVSGRVTELKKARRIVSAGISRKTRSGCSAAVLKRSLGQGELFT